MILVIGQPRSGTSLAMQMIAAAGGNCTGEAPAYEDPRFSMPPFSLDGLQDRDAAKILSMSLLNGLKLPKTSRCIIVTRNREQQISSEWKFVSLLVFGYPRVPPMDRNTRRKYRKAHDKYAEQIRRMVQHHRRAWIRFEDMIDVPESAAAAIAQTIGFGNPKEMAKCVIKRSSDNYPGLLEAQLL